MRELIITRNKSPCHPIALQSTGKKTPTTNISIVFTNTYRKKSVSKKSPPSPPKFPQSEKFLQTLNLFH
jgi:hypothetical protein